MNALDLRYKEASFDVVFSLSSIELSSIEHFGGVECCKRALEEMRRVLKPGGVAAIMTELIVNNADHLSNPNLELFTPETLLELISSSGMHPVEPITFQISEATQKTLLSLEQAIAQPQRLPHIVLEHAGRRFTSISLFLRKP